MFEGYYKKYQKYKQKYKQLKQFYKVYCYNKPSFEEYKNSTLFYKNKYADLIKKAGIMKTPSITLDDINHRLSYESRTLFFMPNIHIGQRKLFISEVQFLIDNLDHKDEKCIVLYAGAAPSNHIYQLKKYFPNIKFVLVDPNPFSIHVSASSTHLEKKVDDIIYLKAQHPVGQTDVYDNKNDIVTFILNSDYSFYLIEDLFTDELAHTLKKLNDHMKVYLWSDIRTNIDVTELISPDDIDVLWNSAQQLLWMNIIKPQVSWLKFRCPFFEPSGIKLMRDHKHEKPYKIDFEKAIDLGIDFIDDYRKKQFRYCKGTINLQTWGPKHSAETRLIVKKEDINNYTIYDHKEYEEKMMYYTSIERNFVFHKHNDINEEKGFDGCGDCALEAYIWNRYKDKYKVDLTIIDEVNTLSRILGKKIKNKNLGHGFLLNEFTDLWYEEVYNNLKQC